MKDDKGTTLNPLGLNLDDNLSLGVYEYCNLFGAVQDNRIAEMKFNNGFQFERVLCIPVSKFFNPNFGAETEQDVMFRIISNNDKEYLKGEKLRANPDSTNFYGEGIYMIDPDIEKDEKNINLLNIFYSIASVTILVLM